MQPYPRWVFPSLAWLYTLELTTAPFLPPPPPFPSNQWGFSGPMTQNMVKNPLLAGDRLAGSLQVWLIVDLRITKNNQLLVRAGFDPACDLRIPSPMRYSLRHIASIRMDLSHGLYSNEPSSAHTIMYKKKLLSIIFTTVSSSHLVSKPMSNNLSASSNTRTSYLKCKN